MKRISLLLLALVLTAGCDRSPTAGNDSAAAQAPVAEPTPVVESAPAAVASNTVAEAPSASAAPAEAAVSTAADAAPQASERIELAQAGAGLDAVEALGYIEGQHYRRLSPAQPTSSSGGRVEVIEFFMYSCIHCYNLEPYVQEWTESKPANIDFVRVPTTWDAFRLLHAQAFYTAKALDKLEEMHTPFFREIHVAGNYLDTPEKVAEFFSRFGVSEEDFESAFNSFAVNTELRRAQELGTRYRIDSTPAFIINGKYRTDVSTAGGPEQLFELIEALAAAERSQG